MAELLKQDKAPGSASLSGGSDRLPPSGISAVLSSEGAEESRMAQETEGKERGYKDAGLSQATEEGDDFIDSEEEYNNDHVAGDNSGRYDFYDDEDEGVYDDGIADIPDDEKTPVTVVTGFLGSGKTTLVNYILREQREMKIAVIENEYGAVSIDTALVEENVREAEDVITMDNGCVCCTVRGDLVKALINFLDRRDTFDCILLETTGIADPSPIVATFNQDIDVRTNYRIDSVLCLVDAKNIITQLGRKSAEPGAVNEAVQQLAFADSVIINKTDLVDEAHLKAVKDKILSVNAFAKIVTAQKSRVPLKSVLNLRSYNLERTLELLDQEAKEEARRKEEEEAKKAKSSSNGNGHSCGDHRSHDHDHGHHEHKHGNEGNDHAHSDAGTGHHKCGKGCSHDHGHGEKRKHDDGHAPAAKKQRELVKVSATRHDSQVGSLSLSLRGSFDVDLFNDFMREFLKDHSADLFRQKGVLSFKNQAQKFVFQGVHEQVNCEPSMIEWAADGSDRESKIVFIGLRLDQDYIAKRLRECLSTE